MAVADVGVGLAFGGGGHHRQYRRGPVEGLYLALFVHAQHEGTLGWVEIQADDVVELVHEVRVGGLPVVDFVRFELECPPDSRPRFGSARYGRPSSASTSACRRPAEPAPAWPSPPARPG